MTSSTDDFDDDFDDFDGFDDEDEKRGVSGLVVLLIILAMLLAFSFIVSMAYSKGIRQGALSDTPQISADPSPVKTPATNASSGSVTAENREVYDRIDGNTATRTEVLAEASEEPLINTGSSDPIAELAAAAQNETQVATDSLVTGVESARESIESVAARATNVTNSVRGTVADTVDSESVLSTKDPLESVIRDAVNESEVRRPATTVTPAFTQNVSGNVSGTHVVQVGAFRSEGEADNYWARLNDRFAGFLDGKGKDIEFADLGARGVYYRLRIAGFNSKDEASSYCEGLKARSQDCLVKSR